LAKPGHAYAGQIVQGADKRFYLYAPVEQGNSGNEDPFAIGVAVADDILGPWQDAHPEGPIISQSVPQSNNIQNIDPTLMVDRDGRVYLYWGTFGQLRGIELEPDMVTPKGREIKVNTLTGFFEASRIFRRKNAYYLLYADDQAGPDSPCTQAIYQACIVYGTAPAALGPWTYQGVILDVVSSTTSHPGVAEFRGQWYLAYHTADAKGGGHFRRSVAIDPWSGTIVSHPRAFLRLSRLISLNPRPHQPATSPPPHLRAPRMRPYLFNIGSRRSMMASYAPTRSHLICGVVGRRIIFQASRSNTSGTSRSRSTSRVFAFGPITRPAQTRVWRRLPCGTWSSGPGESGLRLRAKPATQLPATPLPTSTSRR
jgi:hypothetical protein